MASDMASLVIKAIKTSGMRVPQSSIEKIKAFYGNNIPKKEVKNKRR